MWAIGSFNHICNRPVQWGVGKSADHISLLIMIYINTILFYNFILSNFSTSAVAMVYDTVLYYCIKEGGCPQGVNSSMFI